MICSIRLLIVIVGGLLGLATLILVQDVRARARQRYGGPKYDVLRSLDSRVELRRYAPRVVAQVQVDGDEKTALNKGFRILAAYIFGKTTRQGKIEMTAPVVVRQSEKIVMISPVTASITDDSMTMRFFMPERYSLNTLPKPQDQRIELLELPEESFAATCFSGSWSTANFAREADKLLACLKKNNLEPAGAPINAYYDPPFTPTFMRHNEVLVPLAQ